MKNFDGICSVLGRRANAVSFIKGSAKYPDIYGRVLFYKLKNGVIVRAEIEGLPDENVECEHPVFAFHIHNGTECTGNETDAFYNANGHFNPKNCLHPYHAGDMPPLFGVNGRAFSVFLTDRFTVSEILGKTIIIHRNADDFTTQPSGNAGEKMACGVINKIAK